MIAYFTPNEEATARAYIRSRRTMLQAWAQYEASKTMNDYNHFHSTAEESERCHRQLRDAVRAASRLDAYQYDTILDELGYMEMLRAMESVS